MQSRLGHATPHLTLGLYAHVSDDVDRAAAGRLEDFLNREDAERTVGNAPRETWDCVQTE